MSFRVKTAIAAAALLAFAPPAFVQAQQPPVKEFTLMLTEDDLNLIWDKLSEVPWKQVAPLMIKLQQQYAAQNRSPTAQQPTSPNPQR